MAASTASDPELAKNTFSRIRHLPQQPFGQNAGQRRDVHLHEIWQVAVENVLQRIAHARIVAAEREDAKAAQQIEITVAGPVEKILAAAGLEADVEADGLEHPHHLLVEMARVQRVALCFPRPRTAMRYRGPCRSPAAQLLCQFRVTNRIRPVQSATAMAFSAFTWRHFLRPSVGVQCPANL